MARFVQFLLFVELILIIPSQQSPRHGFNAELLHADNELLSHTVIEPAALGSFIHRNRRDVKMSSSETSNLKSAKDTPMAKKSPNTSQSTVNLRDNATITTTNKIPTAVSIFHLFHFYLQRI